MKGEQLVTREDLIASARSAGLLSDLLGPEKIEAAREELLRIVAELPLVPSPLSKCLALFLVCYIEIFLEAGADAAEEFARKFYATHSVELLNQKRLLLGGHLAVPSVCDIPPESGADFTNPEPSLLSTGSPGDEGGFENAEESHPEIKADENQKGKP